MKLFRIIKKDTGTTLNFNSIQEIDALINPSFNAIELKEFYNNNDPNFSITTHTPHTMKRVGALNDSEQVSLLEHFEAGSYEISAEYGTYHDSYLITNHAKAIKHSSEEYKYLFVLPDYAADDAVVYVSNDDNHYAALRKVMTDGVQTKQRG